MLTMTTRTTGVPKQAAAPRTETTVGPLDTEQLRPYISVMLLQASGAADPAAAFAQLERQVRKHQESNQRITGLLADGFSASAHQVSKEPQLFDEVTGMIWRNEAAPPWAGQHSAYTDVEHELSLLLRYRQFIAVHGSDTLLRAISRWTDASPRPALRRLTEGVLNAAFLQDSESKNLWMRGIRGSSRSRADSKALAGISLGDALDPLADAAFRFSSARVRLLDTPERIHVTGSLGATPGTAKVWLRPSSSWLDFSVTVREILGHVEATAQSGTELTNPFPILASSVEGLTGVGEAFEFRCAPLTDVLAEAGVSPERADAAERLQQVAFTVDPVRGQHSALLRFHRPQGGSGVLRADVREDEGRVKVVFGLEGDQTDPAAASEVRRDLELLNDFSLHYTSGHAVFPDGAYQIRQQTAPFQNWDWRDFTGFDLEQEKPATVTGVSVHDRIATPGDTSLFAWVVARYNDGVLLCDDGAGEIADFLHIGNDGTLRFIHVKAAHSRSSARRVSVSPYEVVVGQAVKNLVSAPPEQLAEHLQRSGVKNPAAWSSGQRVHGRQDFLEMLAARRPTDTTEVVVVQPHVTRAHYTAAASPARKIHHETHRMRLLHTLLNTAHAACIGSGAGFVVVGSA